MKYLLIILVFLNLFNVSLVSQELEQVLSPITARGVVGDSLLTTEDSIIESINHMMSGESSSMPEIQDEERDPSTYRKEEYLNKLLRHTYYQRLLTPAWSKYLNAPSWKENVKKWRYWTQLKNYIAGNDEEILVIRKKVAAKKEETIKDTSITVAVDSSLLDEETDTTHINEKEKTIAEIIKESPESKDVAIKEVKKTPINIDNPATNKAKPIEPKDLITVDPIKEENKTPKTEKDPIPDEIKRTTSSPEKIVKESPKKPVPVENLAGTSNMSFGQKIGKLEWPVSKGRITDSFGIRKDAEARGLRPENYGIDMLCPAGSIVKAVHEGTVLMAKRQSPYDFIVTVKHGHYTTAYYYLINPYVKPGDQILEGGAIGQLRTSVEEADFHFEIWDNQERINPELWLKKR